MRRYLHNVFRQFTIAVKYVSIFVHCHASQTSLFYFTDALLQMETEKSMYEVDKSDIHHLSSLHQTKCNFIIFFFLHLAIENYHYHNGTYFYYQLSIVWTFYNWTSFSFILFLIKNEYPNYNDVWIRLKSNE